MINREEFTIGFFRFLKDIDYIILKYVEDDISKIGKYSDIDLATTKDGRHKIIQYISSNKVTYKYRVYQSSFMDMIYIFFHDNSFLEIDLIRVFARKNLIYIDMKDMLNSRQVNHEGIMVPSSEYQFIYIYLFYLLNHADMDIKYQDYFKKLSTRAQNNIFHFVANKYNINTKQLDVFFVFNIDIYNRILANLRKENRFLKQVLNMKNYFFDMLKNREKSKTITFSGVDGAGKTTILTEIKELLSKKYRKNVVVLRHRPSVLPILSAIKHGKKEAEKKTMEVLPRTGRNNSTLSSLIRFFYYLVDYIFGQWIVFFKHSLKGDIIIYDRYYFDFISDSRRANIQLNEKFIKFFYRFVFKPDINIFLYASPEIILSRKQEMDEESIVELTTKYITLFDTLSANDKEKYICIENIDKEKTLKTVETLYIEVA